MRLKEKTIRFSLHIPNSMWEEIMIECEKVGATPSRLIRLAVHKYLQELEVRRIRREEE